MWSAATLSKRDVFTESTAGPPGTCNKEDKTFSYLSSLRKLFSCPVPLQMVLYVHFKTMKITIEKLRESCVAVGRVELGVLRSQSV